MQEPQPFAGSPLTPQHPPLSPGMLSPRRTVWPTVVGVTAITLGSLAILGGFANMATPLLVSFMPNMSGQSGFDPFAGVAQWRGWLLIIGASSALLGGLLLTGGIMLASRNAATRVIILIWAISKMLLAVGSSLVGYQLQQAQLTSMQQSGVSPSGMQTFMSVAGIVGLAFSIIWLWALPVFMIIWFMRGPIRREVESWREPVRAAQVPGIAAP